jgi:putative ABC transport system ATP-binding protein
MIRFIDVKKTYFKPYNKVLDGISFDVENGSMIAVMGRSEVGKTTLLMLHGCLERIDSGSYWYNDIEVSDLKKKDFDKFRKEHISFIFQNFELIPEYSVYENVEIPLLARNIVKRKEKINSALKRVGIWDYRKKKPHKISGGEQQRCAIARAIVADTDIILADEPTGALDGETAGEIMGLLKSLKQQGKTIIVVTHDEKVASYCDYVIQIKKGKIVR